MTNSLINPNQLQAYGLKVSDDPFDKTRAFGIDSEHVFIPFDTTGTIVHFDSRVPTEWEKTHLPVILMMNEEWNPTSEVLHLNKQSREDTEIRTIRPLTTGIYTTTSRHADHTTRHIGVEQRGETEIVLGNISEAFHYKDFCDRLISSVNIAMAYRDNIDQWDDERRMSSMITND
jgi:hypothetical protein